MANFNKLALSLLAAPAMLLASSQALAITTPAECGNYDFNLNNLDCKIKVDAECNLDCSSLNFQAGCDGECKGEPIPGCTDPCADACNSSCDPATIDCIGNCKEECEQPFIAKCETENPDRDCVTDAKASCATRCRESCTTMPASDCSEACTTCCHGSCTSYENMSCDVACYAKLEGRCEAQCSAGGALMCKDKAGVYQFVNASDVKACINALVAQGLQVDVSAQGEVTCNLSGCNGAGNANAGGLACSASPGQESPFAAGALALAAIGAGISVARRKNRKDAR
ncbi:MYXO-CTERM sorting domain-containing protein [Polyangium aurulentum]|uniref:MYXO-CTERM sorting domain-containing protein n=1 Tax=Polyangium aurulentum TaxID=2567896 RepID=UPI0010ADD2F6|nr:MYXO-CTERM sorting domain-containing protein [Polyangium aurulentum]UQA61897.1 hypothetical protein E8A73_016060 [Polyangium aurulentum]